MSLIIAFPVDNNHISYNLQRSANVWSCRVLPGFIWVGFSSSPGRNFQTGTREDPGLTPVACLSSSTSQALDFFRTHSSCCRNLSYFRTGGVTFRKREDTTQGGIDTTPDPLWSDITRVISPPTPFFRAGSRTGGLPQEDHAARTGRAIVTKTPIKGSRVQMIDQVSISISDESQPAPNRIFFF